MCELTLQDALMTFFEANFADAIPLIGRARLVEDFFSNPTSPLIIIKVSSGTSLSC